ncbi:efflux RND transporter periplasmic adaptor subunit [Neptunomonas antarctica]|uniref:RND family efflux transporter, MFP subunit n=1 Tax=Neptunomonas antarctica TaxID=619304 RepID=A0A1N7NI35_9GAMM|nr:efflux RND transporter periplasmic adaptor subunit [Neptunomonas antarctica]SIS97982.1 RND family efflux transporter, MFP subunit [Neptunomonas antarctica]
MKTSEQIDQDHRQKEEQKMISDENGMQVNPLNKPKGTKRWIFIVAALFLMAMVVLFLDELEQQTKVITGNKIATLPTVSYFTVIPDSYSATVRVLAEAKPRWRTEIKSFVRGEIIYISPSLIEGAEVKKDELLLKIKDSTYRAILEEAKNRLKQAELALLLAQHQAKQARRNWSRAGIEGQPDSSLTFHVPQVEVAQAEVDAARAALTEAEEQLKYTQLRAPYDGLITRKFINPGESLEIAQPVAEIMDVSHLDIPVMLDNKQWQLLSRQWKGLPASIVSINRGLKWTAVIEREGGFIDSVSRLRRVHLTYKNTADASLPLLPGEFVRVTLPGNRFNDLIRVPQSAYTRDGLVWYVNSANQIQRYRVKPAFTDDRYFYIPSPSSDSENESVKQNSWHIVVTPLSSYLPGMKVEPHEISPQEMATILGESN